MHVLLNRNWRMARGSTAIFLSPEVFRCGDSESAWLPMAEKQALCPEQQEEIL